MKRFPVIILLIITLASLCFAQNANTPATRRRTTTTTNTNTSTPIEERGAQTNQQSNTQQAPRRRSNAGAAKASATDPTSAGVVAAFDALIDGIRRADVNAVTAVYWNSPQLVLFNNNGTVTRGWEQMRQNRVSSYAKLRDIKLDVRDRHVIMLGAGGAVVTCLWTQSQTADGRPETATGRMTLVFKRVGNEWKAVHLHTSPDQPEPSRVLPSEQAPAKPSQTP